MVKINGEDLMVAETTISAYLASAGYDESRIVVERNGEIVPKIEYKNTALKDGDTIEVVSFVGGG